jgi:hypothetical protein
MNQYITDADPGACLNNILLDGTVDIDPDTDEQGITEFLLKCVWLETTTILGQEITSQQIDGFVVLCQGAQAKALFFAKYHAMSAGLKPFVRVVGKLTTKAHRTVICAEHIQDLLRS